jgi:hypothetical protein
MKRHRLRPAFDDSISNYSAGELESKTRYLLSVDRNWEDLSKISWYQRDVKIKTLRPIVTLVPGGRWLLTGENGGGVKYYDLDDIHGEASVLISPRSCWQDQAVTSLLVDRDEALPVLKFTLLVLMIDEGKIRLVRRF